MQIPPTILFLNLDSSPALEERIREKLDKLNQRYNRIVSCHVVVESSHHHQTKGRMFEVRIDVTVPGGELVVSNHPGKNPAKHDKAFAAMNDAFDAIDRQLERFFDHAHRFVKTHEPHWQSGTVLEIFPTGDYGFLRDESGQTVYFHRHAVAQNKFDELFKDTEISFVLAQDENENGPHATGVKIAVKGD